MYHPSESQDALHIVETVLSGISHEINNRSQTILLTAQVLLEVWEGLKRITDQYFEEHGDFSSGGLDYSMLRQELSTYYSNILRDAQQIEQLVRALQPLIRKDSQPERGAVDLNNLLGSALTLLANSIRRTTENLRQKLDPALPQFQGNSWSILLVILLLFINACRSVRDQRQIIEISTRYSKSEKTVECEICYGGAEIPQQLLSRLRAVLSGLESGPVDSYLGMATVGKVMSAHGGVIEIDSAAGKGTQVTLSFPVQPEGD